MSTVTSEDWNPTDGNETFLHLDASSILGREWTALCRFERILAVGLYKRAE
jgi:hypothetical protein